MKQNITERGIATGALIAIIGVLAVGGILAIMQMGGSDNKMSDKEQMMDDMNDERSQDAMADDMNNEENMNTNGVRVGGAMMVPNLDIVANAQNADNVTTVVAAVSAAGLVDTLKSDGPFTVFAPNNAAFEALPAGTVETLLKPENKDDLVNILTYHVVPGRYTSSDLSNGQILTTVQGEDITIGKANGNITVNGSAMVETADVISSNGVTFVIDGVLLPPEA